MTLKHIYSTQVIRYMTKRKRAACVSSGCRLSRLEREAWRPQAAGKLSSVTMERTAPNVRVLIPSHVLIEKNRVAI